MENCKEVRLIDANALLKKKREMELCFAVPEWEIENALTIDPESLRARGKWEKHYHSYFGLHQCVCSECKEDEYWKKFYCYGHEKFCPNCGAIMEEMK